MATIEIPFAPGTRVYSTTGCTFVVNEVRCADGQWDFYDSRTCHWFPASALSRSSDRLTWERAMAGCWRGSTRDAITSWYAWEDGRLYQGTKFLGRFDNPKREAERRLARELARS